MDSLTRIPAMPSVEFTPARSADVPIYIQLYQRYREAIASGKLAAGDRVPSVRSLASELNLSRGTVEQAYQLLISEGYLEARGPAGTVVSPRLESVDVPQVQKLQSEPVARPGRHIEHRSQALLRLGVPAMDAFPRKTWARLEGHQVRTLGMAALSYPNPAGYRPLRRAVAAYLGISRGISCRPEQVFITPGYRGALDLICHTLLQRGDTGWFEDPGYLHARQFLERAGMELVPVPVDDEGLQVEQGRALAPHARFAVVTPTHQSPTGVALSLPRRLALLDWAERAQSWIVEDDYDSEFRYHGRPLPALKSLDGHGRVLYTGTFSKVLFPGLRLAYLVVPEHLLDLFNDAIDHRPGPGAILAQATVAEFMDGGHFSRHLRRMRSLYAERRGYLVAALEQELGAHVRIQPQAGGMHVLAHLVDVRRSDVGLMETAHGLGVAVHALSAWQRGATPLRQGVMMGFTNVGSAADALEVVRLLGRVFD